MRRLIAIGATCVLALVIPAAGYCLDVPWAWAYANEQAELGESCYNKAVDSYNSIKKWDVSWDTEDEARELKDDFEGRIEKANKALEKLEQGRTYAQHSRDKWAQIVSATYGTRNAESAAENQSLASDLYDSCGALAGKVSRTIEKMEGLIDKLDSYLDGD
jgi:hypothetical protein